MGDCGAADDAAGGPACGGQVLGVLQAANKVGGGVFLRANEIIIGDCCAQVASLLVEINGRRSESVQEDSIHLISKCVGNMCSNNAEFSENIKLFSSLLSGSVCRNFCGLTGRGRHLSLRCVVRHAKRHPSIYIRRRHARLRSKLCGLRA